MGNLKADSVSYVQSLLFFVPEDVSDVQQMLKCAHTYPYISVNTQPQP